MWIAPAEPIGIGAQWRIVDRMDAGPMQLDVVSTATLLARDGPTLEVRLTSVVGMPEEEVFLELDGFNGTVKELAVRGTQDLTLRVDRPVALLRTSRIRTHFVVRGWKGPFPVTVTTDIDQRIRATAEDR